MFQVYAINKSLLDAQLNLNIRYIRPNINIFNPFFKIFKKANYQRFIKKCRGRDLNLVLPVKNVF